MPPRRGAGNTKGMRMLRKRNAHFVRTILHIVQTKCGLCFRPLQRFEKHILALAFRCCFKMQEIKSLSELLYAVRFPVSNGCFAVGFYRRYGNILPCVLRWKDNCVPNVRPGAIAFGLSRQGCLPERCGSGCMPCPRTRPWQSVLAVLSCGRLGAARL